MNIKKITSKTPGFYDFMGPMFGNRDVAKEVGINLYDDSDKAWYVAFQSGRMLGFASVRGRVISDCYVLPPKREQGVFSAILDAVLVDTTGPLRATCTPASLKRFLASGFKTVRRTKNFTFTELKRA